MNESDPVTKPYLTFPLLALLIFLLYLNTLHSPFVFDDSQIIDNYFIQVKNLSLESIRNVITQGFNKNRWLPNLSFALNYYLGGYDVFGFHLVNVFIHVAVALTFYLLANVTLGLPSLTGTFKRRQEIALAAAMLWAVHPLQTNAVTYIVQRMTSMAALFILLSLLLYVKARLTPVPLRKIILFMAAALFGAMALFCKQNSGMLPVMIIGYELFFLSIPNREKNYRRTLVIISGIALATFLLICWLFLGNDPLTRVLKGYGAREFTLGQRLLTEPRIVIHYLSLLALPLPGRLNLAYDYRLSTGLLAPPATILAIAGLFCLTCCIFPLYRRNRLAAFAVFWFLGNLLVESSILPLELIFEHRMYLPSMYLILAGTALFYRLNAQRVKIARILLIGLLLLLSLFTWQRNEVWQDKITLWTDVVTKAPESVRGHVQLGIAYSQANELQKAEELLVRAMELDPTDGFTYLNLGTLLVKQQRYEEAISVYRQAADVRRQVKAYYLNHSLALAYQKKNDFQNSITHARRAIAGNPYYYETYNVLGRAYFKTGRFREAEQTYKRSLQLFPEKGDTLVNLAAVYERTDRIQEAVSILGKALEYDDVDRATALNTLSIIYWRLHNFPESIKAARQAIKLNPDLVDAYVSLGIAYENTGRQDLAFVQFERAWRKGYNMVATYHYWAGKFMEENDIDRAIMYLQEAIRLAPGNPETGDRLKQAYRLKGLQETHQADSED